MKVLITYGSKRGGTEGIARMLCEALIHARIDAFVVPAREVTKATAFDAAIIGGALYANRWHKDARRLVARNARRLGAVPTWFFSSGPLDDSAERTTIAPVRQVAALMARVGAQAHATFGGRLAADARGLVAGAISRGRAVDFRDRARIEAWALGIARALPTAAPKPATRLEGGSLGRLLGHGVAVWAAGAATTAVLLAIVPAPTAATIGTLLAPAFFAIAAYRYHRALGARAPLAVASTFAAVAALLNAAAVMALMAPALPLLASVTGFWLPLGLGFVAAWATGEIATTIPQSSSREPGASPAAALERARTNA